MPLITATMLDLKKQVAENIKATRKAKGYTLKELGEKLGVTESTASKMERGSQNLTLETLERLSSALQIDITVNFS